MNLIKLEPYNVSNYIGYSILFKTRGSYLIKKIISASKSCIKIEHPDLNNSLEFVTRNVYVIID
jgi:hypothetical protein